MKNINMSKKKFEKLPPLELDDKVLHTEAELFYISHGWNQTGDVLKKLYCYNGEYFSNKLYTINQLYDHKDELDIEEFVLPTAFASVGGEIVGYIMPYIRNINLNTLLQDKKLDTKLKVEYLKQVGQILDKVKKIRETTTANDFYLNDVYENNFILNLDTNKINVVDMDSVKIGNNMATCGRFLAPYGQLEIVPKYEKDINSIGGYYKINEDTDLYCYIIMILNLFYGDKITRLSIPNYFVYLDYLNQIGVPKEILEMFSNIYTGHKNENPYEYLEELIPFDGRMSKNVFDVVRTRGLRGLTRL